MNDLMDSDNSVERRDFNIKIKRIINIIQFIYTIITIIVIITIEPGNKIVSCNTKFITWSWLYCIIILIIINIITIFTKLIYASFKSEYRFINYLLLLISLLYSIIEYKLSRCDNIILQLHIIITLLLIIKFIICSFCIDLYYYKLKINYNNINNVINRNHNYIL